MGEHPGGDDGVVALEDAHDVLEGLAHVDADLLATRVDRVAAELDDRHLHRLSGAGGRLLEDQHRRRVRRAAGRARAVVALGEVEDRPQLGRGEVGDVEQVARHRGQCLGDHGQCFVDLVVGHGQRRSEAQRGRRDGVGDEAVVEQAAVHLAGVVAVELGGEQQPTAADGGDAGDGCQRISQPLALGGGERRRVEAAHLGDHRVDGGRGDRRAAVRAAVVAGLEHGGDVTARPAARRPASRCPSPWPA